MAMGVKGTRDGIVDLVDMFGGASDERPRRIVKENSTVIRRDRKTIPEDVRVKTSRSGEE